MYANGENNNAEIHVGYEQSLDEIEFVIGRYDISFEQIKYRIKTQLEGLNQQLANLAKLIEQLLSLPSSSTTTMGSSNANIARRIVVKH